MMCLFLAAPAIATTWTVDDDGADFPDADFVAIQDAIVAASNGDEVLVYPGTYTGTGSEVITTLGKVITVRAIGSVEATIIDGQGARRGVGLSNNETVATVIDGFTITGGTASSNGSIVCSQSSPTIRNCLIVGNSAGGIFCQYSSSPTITNCMIENNTANYGGGGIYCTSNCNPTIIDCTITNNTANNDGGGIYCTSNSSPTITGCAISYNTTVGTSSNGGGISCGFESNPTITNCVIEGNISDRDGGGIYCYSISSPTIVDSTISNNTANDDGGGIYCSSSSSTDLTNAIICGNTPDQIDGTWIDGGGTCVATICDDVNGDGVPDECGGGSDGILEVPSEYATIQAAIYAAVDGDIVLVAPGTYTGTGTWVINPLGKSITIRASGSPQETIISAEDAFRRVIECTSGETAATLVEGFTITGGSHNMGSGIWCRWGSNPTISNCVIEGNAAMFSDGGGIYCEDGSNPTIVDCTIASNTSGAWGGGICCDQSNPTITNCLITNNTAEYGGGGISCLNGSVPTIIGCTISSNSNTGTSVGMGGGIHCDQSSPTIINCVIESNISTNYFGGGLACQSDSTPMVMGCTISANTALRRGGGIYCDQSSPAITNCQILNNTAAWFGGGIYCFNASSPTIDDCVISNNTAVDEQGGGIACDGSSPTLTGCWIEDNTANVTGGVMCTHNSVLTIRNCTIDGNTDAFGGYGVFVHAGSTLSLHETGVCDAIRTLDSGVLLFAAESQYNISPDVTQSSNGTTIFDLDDLQTTASLEASGMFHRQGSLGITNDSNSLAAAETDDIIPLARAATLIDDFDSVVFPMMPPDLALQLIERPFTRGGGTEIAVEVIAIDTPNFADPFSEGLDDPPIDLVAFDADGDGGEEVAVLFGDTSGSVAAYDVTEDAAPTAIPGLAALVGNGPVDIDAADLDGDGDDDLVIANGDDATLTVLINEDGTSFSVITIPVAGDAITCVAAIDWDGDSNLDAVVGVDVAGASAEDRYQVMLDIATAVATGPAFTIPKFESVSGSLIPDPPTSVTGGNASSVWGFAGGTRYGRVHHATQSSSILDVLANLVGSNISEIVAADLDEDGGDGFIDIVAASNEAESLLIFPGTVVGFGDLIPISVSEPVEDLVAVDADGDGDTDFIITSPTSSSDPLLLLRNDDPAGPPLRSLGGRNWSKQVIGGDLSPSLLASGTLDPKDEDDDWLLGGGTTSLLLGDEGSAFEQTNLLSGPACEADTDADGQVDVNDVLAVVAAWGSSDPGADVNGDGIVNTDDLLAVIGNWGPCE
jgi:parallel beta-helix repeat protein/predicted outer membrane repeat protein